MAKKASPAGAASKSKRSSTSKAGGAARKPTRALAKPRSSGEGDFNAVDALLKLLQSPLVADLLAVGATAAIAAITEGRHSRKSGGEAAAKTMMKAAGVAAAAAIGRRLATEFEEIREVSKKASNAKA
jgi:hypothetical protein